MMIDSGGAAFLAESMLKVFEGLRLAPYLCPAGRWSIGYGHVILPNERHLFNGITEEVADMLLLHDLAWALYAARSVGRVLTDGQAAALACLIYNIGLQAWADSTIRRLVMAGDMAGAAAQFERWCKVNGVANGGLSNRRGRERHIFEGGTWNG